MPNNDDSSTQAGPAADLFTRETFVKRILPVAIIALGLAALIATRVAPTYQAHPMFYLAGTSVDCAVSR
jgi:hypothetical protein